MRDFFKPWRRKAGVVTLGMACVFMAGWVRAGVAMDLLRFGGDKRQQGVVSLNGELCWWAWNVSEVDWRFQPNERPFSDAVAHETDRTGYKLRPMEMAGVNGLFRIA